MGGVRGVAQSCRDRRYRVHIIYAISLVMNETQEKAQVTPIPEHVRGQLTTAELALAQAAHGLRAGTPAWIACSEAMAAVDRVRTAWLTQHEGEV